MRLDIQTFTRNTINPFPYIGNKKEFLGTDNILKHIKSLPAGAWEPLSGYTHQQQHNANRPEEEKKQFRWYEKCSTHDNTMITDMNFLPDEWFDLVGANKDGHILKCYRTWPGTFEPPHKDFFPSFIGFYDANGVRWTQDEIAARGKTIVRYWIPLIDGQVGHILFGDDYALTNWLAGDCFELPSGVTHGFANGGRQERYVMVFTAWRK
jgi:hypothetical protein